MIEKKSLVCQSSGLSLPPVVKTLSGAVFDPSLQRWTFHDGLEPISVNFERLSPYASEELIEAAKFPMIWYAENAEGKSLKSIFNNLKRLLKASAATQGRQVSVIDAALLINYRVTLNPNMEWRLGALSAYLKKWGSLGVSGITDDAIRYLKSIRLKGGLKGTAVMTMDPLAGPLTGLERAAVQVALNDGFALGEVSLSDYLLAWLSLLLGQRNIQFAMLKVCDVSEVAKADGSLEYVLRVPRAKQASSEMRRDQFKDRLITSSIGKMLASYAQDIREEFENHDVYAGDATQAPLFPEKIRRNCIRPSFHNHATPDDLGRRIRAIFDSLQVYSERTGEPIKVNSKRLRHTVATIAAREGHGELIVAELLDHSDTQNVGVYVQATPEIVERIDRALAFRMAPLARAFIGTIICDESKALRSNDPASRIVDPRFDENMRPMGNCSRHGPCSFLAPIACYTCKSFQAWADGPHEAVLSYLIAERERLMQDIDERIAMVNDRTILAAADVVRQCQNLHGLGTDG